MVKFGGGEYRIKSQCLDEFKTIDLSHENCCYVIQCGIVATDRYTNEIFTASKWTLTFPSINAINLQNGSYFILCKLMGPGKGGL